MNTKELPFIFNQSNLLPFKILKLIILLLILTIAGWITIQHLLSGPAERRPASNHSAFDVIAHRGGCGLAPENTLMAFEVSNRIGVDVLEMDIHLTKDYELVVIHDSTLNRTTDGNGKVKDFSLIEIQRFDAAYFFSPDPTYRNRRDSSIYKNLKNNGGLFPLRGKGVSIPKLQNIFERFRKIRMIIEIKPNNNNIVKPFCQMIKDFNKEDQIIVGSFYGKVLEAFRQNCPEVATSAFSLETAQFVLSDKIKLSGMINPLYVALQIPPLLKKKFWGHQISISVASRSLIRAAVKKRLIVQVWTVNEPNEMRKLFNLGVNGIMTDYPDRLLKIIGR